jgi:hypothetical protein
VTFISYCFKIYNFKYSNKMVVVSCQGDTVVHLMSESENLYDNAHLKNMYTVIAIGLQVSSEGEIAW